MSTPSDSGEVPDALPSKRTVPRLSLRPLKTLAPKPPHPERPVPSRSATTTTTSSLQGPRSSPICPVCRRRACPLASHKAWTRDRKHVIQSGEIFVQAKSGPTFVNDPTYANSYAYRFTQSFVDVNIAAGRVDPFYKLPIPDSTHPQLHRLFHDCKHPPDLPPCSPPLGDTVPDASLPVFTVQLNRAVAFPRPSCFTSDPLGGVLAPAAMIDPAVCLSVVSMSATGAAMRTGRQARNASAKALYGQAMQMLRDRFGTHPITDETILAAVTLWVVSVPFANELAVRQNRTVVRGLVKKRGGPLRLGMAGMLADYVVWAEVLSALWLNDEPEFVGDAVPGFLVAPPPAIYGAAFHSPDVAESLHPTTIEICITICRMTEVLEKATREESTPQEYMYFYSTLKWVGIRRTRFRAVCYNSGTKDECLGNALEIFRINVFATQPENKMFNWGFCSQLQRALLQTDLFSYWDRHNQMLVWILFIVGTIESDWETRHWFMDLLRRSISYTYANENWPDTWREEALQNLESYIWCERLSDHFARICDELEHLPAQQPETGLDPLLAIGKA